MDEGTSFGGWWIEGKLIGLVDRWESSGWRSICEYRAVDRLTVVDCIGG